jgi:ADP-heptose:LPS heptosyltransferase
MWAGVIAALARDRRPLILAMQPKLSDLLAGRDYDCSAQLSSDPVFRGNPNVGFTTYRPKGAFVRRLDGLFMAVLERLGLRRRIEHALAARALAAPGPLLLYVDMEIHSYSEAQFGPPERRRLRWKSGGHAISTMLASFAPGREAAPPEIWLDAADHARAIRLMAELGIEAPFLVIEPETNGEFFGDLRAWPFERWQAVVAALVGEGHRVAQIGLPGGRALAGALDLRGRTDFRTACAMLARARLFLGTESGLMHAARAVGTDAVIVWGGVTLPEFAGYPDSHAIVCHRVACASCGNLGWCDNKRICMLDIDTTEVLTRIRARLAGS